MNKTYEVPERKVCEWCEIEKPVSDFNLHHVKIKGGSRYRGECKECQKIWRQENVEVLREWRKKYYLAHLDEIKRKKQEYLSNPENREKNRAYAKEYQRRKPEMQRSRQLAKYGITHEDYQKILDKQNGRCAICGKEGNGKQMNFSVDHDHKTGAVRALLCTQCNAGLGNYRDDPSLLRKAATYLETF